MTEIQADVLDEIWAGDLFGRRNEAIQLATYIECLAGRPLLREDKHAYTVAVEGGYGEGKSFFLKRLAKHLALNHPVAFVDAWADDLADEPLTALAATLKMALAPYVAEPEIQSRMTSFMRKTGKVAKIASLGLARRAISLAITGVAVEAIEDVVSETSEAVQDAVNDGMKSASEDTVADVAATIKSLTSHELMEKRVTDFEEGRAAIQEMKDSLAAIVTSLDERDHHPPIVIIIDELDRCRPTYALKLLEEIKHLFDVPGLVFILGMHIGQLGHSVSGAYGANFDGRAYLRRFIDREYRLAEPELRALVHRLRIQAGLSEQTIRFQPAALIEKGSGQNGFDDIIAEYMRLYGLKARDAFQLVDILQTSVALADGHSLEGLYLLPLAIGAVLGEARGKLPTTDGNAKLMYNRTTGGANRQRIGVTFQKAAEEFEAAALMNDRSINDLGESENVTWGVSVIYHTRDWNSRPLPLWDVARYPDLISTVGRFTNPAAKAKSEGSESDA
ncbi:KAP family P-loop NTPase fold protein [Sphingopyxis fribergensis]